MNLRALLFDVDGTLADTERFGHRPAYNRAFKDLKLGFRWSAPLYRELLQLPGGRERLLYFLDHHQPELGDYSDTVQQDASAWVERVHRLKSHYFDQYVRRGRVPLRPGVARLIGEAKAAGLQVALVSNASPASLQPVLRYALGAELLKAIDVVVGGEPGRRKKPAPDAYQHALRLLGRAPGECVAIEDSEMGLTAATAAGIATVITATSNTAHEDFTAAALVLDQLGDPGNPARVRKGRVQLDYLTLTDLRALGAYRAQAA